jgi:hypothetical protein
MNRSSFFHRQPTAANSPSESSVVSRLLAPAAVGRGSVRRRGLPPAWTKPHEPQMNRRELTRSKLKSCAPIAFRGRETSSKTVGCQLALLAPIGGFPIGSSFVAKPTGKPRRRAEPRPTAPGVHIAPCPPCDSSASILTRNAGIKRKLAPRSRNQFKVDKPQNIGYSVSSIHYKLCLFIACKSPSAAYC